MDRIAVVTGAGRGIGLEFCRQLLESGAIVVACPRRPGSEGLAQLRRDRPDRAFEIPMDISDDASVAAGAEEIGRRVDRVDLLINNGGVYPHDGSLESLDTDALVDAFSVNAVGALRVTRALLPLLREGRDRKLVQITSLMGSIADNGSGGSYGYRMSKTALNMAVRNLAHELGPEGFVALAMHPGWVQTRMGGSGAPLGPRDAVSSMLRTALAAGDDSNGAFLNYEGKALPY